MRAKALAIEAFVLPKFLYVARHANHILRELKKCQSEVNSLLKSGKKMEVKAENLYLNVTNGGIGLPYVLAKLIAAHVLDFSRHTSHYNPDFSKQIQPFYFVINDDMQHLTEQDIPSLSPTQMSKRV